MRVRLARLLLLLVAAPAAAAGPNAAATEPATAQDEAPVAWTIGDRKAAHRTHLVSVGVGAWPTALSSHVWYAVPLLRRGLLPQVNDGFALEFGALANWDHHGSVALWPAAGVRWDFYLTPSWAIFFGLKVAAAIALNQDQGVRPDAVVGFGGVLRLAERALLRMELGWPQGLTVGLAFPLGHP